MPEDVRGLAQRFGEIFNLWPPMAETRKSANARAKWAEFLRENARSTDGTAIDPVPLWRIIKSEGKFLVTSPASTVKTVRGKYAIESLYRR
jgi:hypothetical protein